MKFNLEPYHRNISDEDLIKDLVRVSKEIEKDKVTIDEYNERGKFHNTTLTRRFGSWLTALKKAGLKKTKEHNISDEELFNNLAEVWLTLGRQPRYNDLVKGKISKYSVGTYEKRFGGWRKFLELFVKWANDGNVISPIAKKKSSEKKTQRNINLRLRALMLMRDGACKLCGYGPNEGVKLQVDHVKPWSKGGETVLENLQILCEKCNIGKSNIEI